MSESVGFIPILRVTCRTSAAVWAHSIGFDGDLPLFFLATHLPAFVPDENATMQGAVPENSHNVLDPAASTLEMGFNREFILHPFECPRLTNLLQQLYRSRPFSVRYVDMVPPTDIQNIV